MENPQDEKFLKAYRNRIDDLTRVVFADQIVVVLDSPAPTRPVAAQE